MKHVLRAQDFDRLWIEDFFPKVRSLKAQLQTSDEKAKLKEAFPRKLMYAFFYEKSTRTRFSFCTAAMNLGMNVLWTEDAREFSSAAKGETLEDTIHVLCGYGPDIIILRHSEDDAEQRAAAISDRCYGGIPIVNAGSGKMQHPTQALLDLFTIWDTLKRLDNLTVVIGADIANGRTCRSLAYLLSKFLNIHIIFVSPKELSPTPELRAHLTEHNTRYDVETDLKKVLPLADIVYWVRLQVERIEETPAKESLVAQYRKFCIGLSEVSLLKKDAILLHPMPIVDEIGKEVKASCSQFLVYEQAQNGLPVRMALLTELLKNR